MNTRKHFQDCIKELNAFIEQWRSLQELVKLSRQAASLDPDNEKKFLEVKTYLARKYTPLANKLGGEAPQPHQIQPINVINQIVTLEHARGMSEIQIRKFETDWHTVYIYINQLLGYVEAHQTDLAKLGSVKIVWRQHGRKLEILGYLLVLIVLVGLGVYFIARMGLLSDIDFKALFEMLKDKISSKSKE